MNYMEKYKRLFFELTIINKKISDLEHSKEVKKYIKDNNANNDDFLVIKYIELCNIKKKLLCELNNYYQQMVINNVYLYSPLELVLNIYDRLKEIYPEKEDSEINHYIKVALYNIRYKDNTFDRQQSRIRRLKLDGLYNNWYYNIERTK